MGAHTETVESKAEVQPGAGESGIGRRSAQQLQAKGSRLLRASRGERVTPKELMEKMGRDGSRREEAKLP